MSTAVELLLLVLPTLWYGFGLRALWRQAGRGHGVSVARALSFGTGLAVIAASLFSPLDELSDALFSAHMLQHLLLIMIAAPLLVLGAPLVPMLWALPAARRRAVGAWWKRSNAVRPSAHVLTQPGVAFALHTIALWFWHFPLPYQAAVEHEWLHALEHFSFVGSAALLWWVVLQPMGRRRASEGVAILVVAGTLMQSGVLGAALVFAQAPWYPVHAASTLARGTTPLEDQQLAGLLMWIPASVVYLGATAWLFLRWMRNDERRMAGRSPMTRVVGGLS